MPDARKALLYDQSNEKLMLYSLITFLHCEDPNLKKIDINAPISVLNEVTFLFAVSLVETHYGFIVPDRTLADKNKSLRQLSNEIQSLPRLGDTVKSTLVDIFRIN
jgi:hypothetical protein